MIAASHDQQTLSGKSHAVLAACLSCLVMITILLWPSLTTLVMNDASGSNATIAIKRYGETTGIQDSYSQASWIDSSIHSN